jgi:hypothetical protein
MGGAPVVTDSQSSADIPRLVEELHVPWARREARRKLVALGAVDALLECLDADNESVVWSAVESLGELRAQEAVEPLADLLARGVLVLDVCEALTQITGQDFGADAAKWKEWIAGPQKGKPAELDAKDCVRRTAEYLGVEPVGSRRSFRFKLPLDEGRSQKVNVYFGREDPDGDELVVIYSECGPAHPKLYETVLRKNTAMPAGAFAIRDIDGKPHFVVVDTMIAATVTPRALAKKIENIAARADSVEKALTKEDTR